MSPTRPPHADGRDGSGVGAGKDGPPRDVGRGLARSIEVMDRLRSPGGCPWDAEQTHASLARYLVEETYEALEAIETGDRALLREELGDLLLQVLFHARLAEELPPGERFGIDEVANDLADKLIARHPHVFGDGPSGLTAERQTELWEQGKIVEKGRTSAVDGVPPALPALALTAKLVDRAGRAGLAGLEPGPGTATAEERVGARLFALVREAVDAGIDPETALRRTARAYRERIRQAEAQSRRPPPSG